MNTRSRRTILLGALTAGAVGVAAPADAKRRTYRNEGRRSSSAARPTNCPPPRTPVLLNPNNYLDAHVNSRFVIGQDGDYAQCEIATRAPHETCTARLPGGGTLTWDNPEQ